MEKSVGSKRKAVQVTNEPVEKIPRNEEQNSDSDDNEILNHPVAIFKNSDNEGIKGTYRDYTNENLPLSDKLALWSENHEISDEALNDLLDILKSSKRLDSSVTQPKTVTDDNCCLSDSCSTMGLGVEVKKEFHEHSEYDCNGVTLGEVMTKLNSIVSMVCRTNADVGCIKRTLARMENTLPVTEFCNNEDINDIIPDLKLPVQNIEELVRLDYFLSDSENCKKLANKLKFDAVELKKSLYCNFTSIGEKLISNALAAEYSLCGQRGKMRFLDFKYICSFMKYTCKLGYENRNRLFTFSDIEQDKAIGSFLKYIKRNS